MKYLVVIFSLFFSFGAQAQEEHAWVYFKDKPDSASFLENPLLMLSQRALDRRTKQGISLSDEDVPVAAVYINSVKNSTGVTIKAVSKWLNAVHVIGTQSDIEALNNLSEVASIQFANKSLGILEASSVSLPKQKKSQVTTNFNYGSTTNQIEMIGVDDLHDVDYTGQGMQIAVFDGGFKGADTGSAFALLRDNNTNNGEIVGGYDFVNKTDDVYNSVDAEHGTQVLSTMGARIDGSFVGAAPNAQFYLFITEDIVNETPLEESLWVQAAERADSLGVDIINSSLGYFEFDESKYNHTYQDMDGETTFITRGANKAIEKGILVVNSVGNFGAIPFKFLAAPADAKNNISVGAVDASGILANFSSFGPSADGRVKPEIVAQGESTYVINKNNSLVLSSGTSFSAPTIAGATACLWQAFPNKTNLEIRSMLIESANNYSNPTNQGGYGIPDYTSFIPLLNNRLYENSQATLAGMLVQGNTLNLENYLSSISERVIITNIEGKQIVDREITIGNPILSIESLSSGLYFVSMIGNNKIRTFKLLLSK